MLLEGKNAVIYGGGGSIGGAVARAFAREGAQVFLTGRTVEKLEAVAADVRSAGGRAEVARVDAPTRPPSMRMLTPSRLGLAASTSPSI
jgi:NAD(P)-dependent dehydrogenase (short-subunit alcohol dehydrogenase family)